MEKSGGNGLPCLLQSRTSLQRDRRGEVRAPHREEGSGIRKLINVTVDTADLSPATLGKTSECAAN